MLSSLLVMCYEHLALANNIVVRNVGRVMIFSLKILQMLLQKRIISPNLNNVNKRLAAQSTM
jgi:hypothetical protein